MMLAAQHRTPIKKLILNDIGPVTPKAFLDRIVGYIGKAPLQPSVQEASKYLNTIYGPMYGVEVPTNTFDRLARHGYHQTWQRSTGFGPMQSPPLFSQLSPPAKMEGTGDWMTPDVVGKGDGSEIKYQISYDPELISSWVLPFTKDLDLWSIYDAVQPATSTLVLHGLISDLLHDNIAQEMKVRGPKAKVISYPGVGHHPALTTQKEWDDVLNFLS